MVPCLALLGSMHRC